MRIRDWRESEGHVRPIRFESIQSEGKLTKLSERRTMGEDTRRPAERSYATTNARITLGSRSDAQWMATSMHT